LVAEPSSVTSRGSRAAQESREATSARRRSFMAMGARIDSMK
jgi:hypothetical protein